MHNDNVFTPEEVATAQPTDLPPAGYARDEVLAQRKDSLEEQAENLFAEHGTIDPTVFAEDRDIQDILHNRNDGLEVTDPDSSYMYCWANFQSSNGTQVWQRKTWKWEVVSGAMKECSHLKREDGTRRIGDCLLMRIRKDFHLALMMKNDEKRLRQQVGLESQMEEMAAKYPGAFPSGVQKLGVNMSPAYASRMESAARSGASRTAMKQADSMLRKGNMPGLGRPGGGR